MIFSKAADLLQLHVMKAASGTRVPAVMHCHMQAQAGRASLRFGHDIGARTLCERSVTPRSRGDRCAGTGKPGSYAVPSPYSPRSVSIAAPASLPSAPYEKPTAEKLASLPPSSPPDTAAASALVSCCSAAAAGAPGTSTGMSDAFFLMLIQHKVGKSPGDGVALLGMLCGVKPEVLAKCAEVAALQGQS